MACFSRREGFRPRGLSAGEFGLGVGQLLQGVVPFAFQGAGNPAGCRGRRPGNGARLCRPGSGLVRPAVATGPAPHRGCPRVAGRRPAGLQRGRRERRQERLGDRGVDRGATDPQVPGAAPSTRLAGAGAVAGRGLGRPVVVDGEPAPTPPAGSPGLAAARSLGPHHARLRAMGRMLLPDTGLLVVGVPVDEAAMVICDEHSHSPCGSLRRRMRIWSSSPT